MELKPDKRHQQIGFLDKSFGLRQHNDIPVKALLLKEPQRNRVGDAAVEKLPAFHIYDPRRQRHGCRCPYPFVELIAMMHQKFVHRLACNKVSANSIELHRVAVESRHIELIQFVGQCVVVKFCAEDVSRLQ